MKFGGWSKKTDLPISHKNDLLKQSNGKITQELLIINLIEE